MQDQFESLLAASRADPMPLWSVRADRLRRLRRMLHQHRGEFARAIDQDFGQRPRAETDLAEIYPALAAIGHALRHGRGWMRRRPARSGLWFWPARAHLQPRPLGLVGIVVPWNYPLFLAVAPLVDALAAGNRAMIKPSEQAPAFAQALAQAVAQHFDPQELHVVTGGPDVAAAFCALPFDHLFFTGSTAVGRKVMQAAAENLTPVTLELGGKSPALIAPDADLARAVDRIMTGKLLNAGQTCIAPDHVLLPRGSVGPFIDLARDWVAQHYPRLATNPDYCRIINMAQFARLTAWLAEAEAAGARMHPLADCGPDPSTRLMPPVIVTEPQGPLAREEIFGPILPLWPYDRLREAVDHILSRPRPLAFYPFTDNPETVTALTTTVLAGGVTVNDTLLHVAQNDLPFGGVGASGMGACHGKAGFDRMSHLMPVLRQGRWNAAGLMAPPYGTRFHLLIRAMQRLGR
ncbi:MULTISPECIES: coniferyl aldehyde dehydrogenase [unclassified Paracoccus (in: a-proteobacteria)]|uniref:coniferyl aldehyde dehydrogenase n=1 Tax=unclassified Paracoccus (in: a-proteobacteria) TaxID=2688777 RepID=UPI0012B22628|nr:MULTISPECIES: coniferyl aldehyde dehydrogenase [unclassified Paracoccus (in: a-proteobacteria)]UXU73761.1 coniferyl aldehyde dehydrogenase [Paracoccus sp. SMMA_5]UXU79651.1 coniferyl aldehyde dehydrogenase [Paracoccus sp. SMMA_5_TC]